MNVNHIISVTETEEGESYVVVHRHGNREITSNVPKAPGNSDYKVVLEWVDRGGVIGEYVPPVVTDEDVDRKFQNLSIHWQSFIEVYAEREGLTEAQVMTLLKQKARGRPRGRGRGRGIS